MNYPMSQFSIILGNLCMIDTSAYRFPYGFWKVVRRGEQDEQYQAGD